MKKRAFTLVEMVMVIVVMGIVAMIGTNVLVHMYESYISTKITNSLQAKTTHVLDLISKRLSYRIKDSAVTSIDGGVATYIKLSDPSITVNHNILEWIGYDNEGLVGEWDGVTFRGWSGFIDIDNPLTTKSQIVTSGSRLDLIKDTILALSYGDINIDNTPINKTAVIIGQCQHNMEPSSYGFVGANPINVLKMKRSGNSLIIPKDLASAKEYCERYLLAWSAYALVPEGPDSNDFNLTLKYNYQPWEGEKYSTPTTKSAVLSEHVTTFRFIQLGRTIRVKLCITDKNKKFGFCKEKAIF